MLYLDFYIYHKKISKYCNAENESTVLPRFSVKSTVYPKSLEFVHPQHYCEMKNSSGLVNTVPQIACCMQCVATSGHLSYDKRLTSLPWAFMHIVRFGCHH